MDRAKEESRVLSLLDRLPVRYKFLRIGLINPAQIERLTNQKPNPPLNMYVIASPDASALSRNINRVSKQGAEKLLVYPSTSSGQTGQVLKTLVIFRSS